MDTPSNSNNSGVQIRQRRVLPSRSRRGGPGIGSCDVDVMILDTHKRKSENEPLIPGETQFLLTTNTTLVPPVPSSSTSSGERRLNPHTNERYFDRPEVLRAYKEQQVIQTPEFTLLSEDASVGGRFRPRGLEDGTADTSDAAYEKRHRKYETFEKRQRLREKEKLKHEQYKLKERIEQLRAMDGAAFLALPPSTFSPIPGRPADDIDDDESVVSLPGSHINGAAAHNEGERRRKEMLDVALSLEERYRVLLPPDRIKKPGGHGGASTSIEPELEAVGKEARKRFDDGESEVDPEEPYVEVAKKEGEKLKLKIRFPARPNTSLSHSSISKSTPPFKKRKTSLPPPVAKTPLTRSSKTVQIFSPMDPESSQSPPPVESDQSSASSVVMAAEPSMSLAIPLVQVSVSAPSTPLSNPEIAVLETGSPSVAVSPNVEQAQAIDTIESISLNSRPYKRMIEPAPVQPPQLFPQESHIRGREPSMPPIESISMPIPVRRSVSRPAAQHHASSRTHISYAGAAGHAERTTSVLMISAIRTSNLPKARKTQRHLTAFGTKVPQEVDEVRDFELPLWLYGGGLDEASNLDASQPIHVLNGVEDMRESLTVGIKDTLTGPSNPIAEPQDETTGSHNIIDVP